MKKILITAFLSFILLSSTVRAQDAFDIQMKVYGAALKYYDLNVAASALYNAMALKPDRKDLRDSLALVYFAGERYGQSYTVGEEILKDDPKRKDILEMVAVSKQSLGMIKEALADYENLYAADKQLFYLYQMATLQYQLKRYGECVASLDQIIANEASAKQNVSIRNSNGASQSVPMKAAALNVKGIVALELNQDANAKGFFEQSLQVFPDFALAKGNLAQATQKKNPKELGPPTKATPAPKAASR
jgi:tetratricopeptide (TPR) repeat protein